jgi:branched-subunit amino acid aminotransferase/4-amino-4-deoxychorismate lyase
MYAWVNGHIGPSSLASVNIYDLGLLRGYAAFDYLRIYDGTPFRLQDHLDRLRRSCEELGLILPLTDADFVQAIRDLMSKSGLSNAAVRIVVTGGVAEDAITPGEPTVLIMLEKEPDHPQWMYERGVKLITHGFQRESASIKSTNYVTAIRLRKLLASAQADDILYCHDGLVLELTRNNFFCFFKNHLVTPGEHVLKGITRQVILELARERFELEERQVRLADALRADEAFLCGTGKQIMPVVAIDGELIGEGLVGERTRWLMSQYELLIRGHVMAPRGS